MYIHEKKILQAKGNPRSAKSGQSGKDVQKDRARKIAHKKLKLAYLARVQRTLDAATRVKNKKS